MAHLLFSSRFSASVVVNVYAFWGTKSALTVLVTNASEISMCDLSLVSTERVVPAGRSAFATTTVTDCVALPVAWLTMKITIVPAARASSTPNSIIVRPPDARARGGRAGATMCANLLRLAAPGNWAWQPAPVAGGPAIGGVVRRHVSPPPYRECLREQGAASRQATNLPRGKGHPSRVIRPRPRPSAPTPLP